MLKNYLQSVKKSSRRKSKRSSRANSRRGDKSSKSSRIGLFEEFNICNDPIPLKYTQQENVKFTKEQKKMFHKQNKKMVARSFIYKRKASPRLRNNLFNQTNFNNFSFEENEIEAEIQKIQDFKNDERKQIEELLKIVKRQKKLIRKMKKIINKEEKDFKNDSPDKSVNKMKFSSDSKKNFSLTEKFFKEDEEKKELKFDKNKQNCYNSCNLGKRSKSDARYKDVKILFEKNTNLLIDRKKQRNLSNEIKSKLEKFLSIPMKNSNRVIDDEFAARTVTTLKKQNSEEKSGKNNFGINSFFGGKKNKPNFRFNTNLHDNLFSPNLSYHTPILKQKLGEENELVSLLKKQFDCVSQKKCMAKFLELSKNYEKLKKFMKAMYKLILDLTPNEAKNEVEKKQEDLKFMWNWLKNLCVDFMKLKKESSKDQDPGCECFGLIQKLRVLLRVKDKNKLLGNVEGICEELLQFRKLEMRVKGFLRLDPECSKKEMINAFDNIEMLSRVRTNYN